MSRTHPISLTRWLSVRLSKSTRAIRRPAARANALRLLILLCAIPALGGSDLAADLPTNRSEPVEAVKMCNIGGMVGFVLPGSTTCMKIGGYVSGQVSAGWLSKQYGLAFTGTPGASPVTSSELTPISNRDALGFSSHVQLNIDVRDQTSYGVLRGYAEMLYEDSSGFEGGFQGGGPAGTALINVAYVQFAGLTAGRAPSFFSYLAGGLSWYDFYSPDRTYGNQPDLLAYTATFGNGFSTTISLEDPSGANVNNGVNGGFSNTYFGERLPDVIGVLRVDQTWGSAQLSAAFHNTRAIGVSLDTINIWGAAVLGGITVNLPSLATGDRFAVQGVYTHAALGYSGIVNTAWSPLDQGFNMNGNGTIFQLTDVLNYDVGLWSTPTTWSAAAYFEHHLSPQFSLGPEASIARVHYSGSPVEISASANSFLGGGIAHWDPVQHLDFQFGVMYQYTHQARPASYVGPTPFTAVSSGLAGTIEVVRDF